ncbi:MAG: hypothetical protein JO186_00125 [Actinobacteria bacterium]|nr:hypothetical protein [Actinomycetota bacterium]
MTATVPAGATAAATRFTLTIYANSVAKTLQSAHRGTRSIPSGAVGVVQFTLDDGGIPLLKPVQFAIATPNAPSGSIFRLAGLGTYPDPANPGNSITSFNDVDTVTWSNGTATEDENVAYPRTSLASNTYYDLYTVPQANAASGPGTVALTVTQATPGAIPAFGTSTFTVSELGQFGFPYLDPAPSFALDNAALGTIGTTSGVLTAGTVDATGHVVATETTTGRGSPQGKLAVAVSSQRPGYSGDTFSYTGTLSSTTQLTSANLTTQPQTSTVTVALTSTVGAAFTATTGGGQNVVTSAETDTYPLQTVTTNTTSTYTYAASGASGTLSILSSDAKDSNGAEYTTQYGNGNGILDVLPETTGSFGPNTAALTYVEKDPARFGRQRTVAANGSYTETDHDAFGTSQTITVNPNFSATLDDSQLDGFTFTLAAPTGSPPTISITVTQAPNHATETVPSWFPAGMTAISNETDVDNGSKSFPTACAVPAKYGTSGNQVIQTIQRVDPALGNAETETTTTYLAPVVGPVCIQLTDNVQTFYNYTGQAGSIAIVPSGNAQPLQLTSMNETLTLQSASTSGGAVTSSTKRATSSALSRSAFAPVALARVRFERFVREKLSAHKPTVSRALFNHGVQAQ